HFLGLLLLWRHQLAHSTVAHHCPSACLLLSTDTQHANNSFIFDCGEPYCLLLRVQLARLSYTDTVCQSCGSWACFDLLRGRVCLDDGPLLFEYSVVTI